MNDDVTLGGVATRDFVGVSEADTFREAVDLMAEAGAAHALVVRGDDPVGLLRASDVYDRVASNGSVPETPVTDVMSDPPASLSPTATVADAVTAMAESGADVVAVADGPDLLGTVSARDLIAAAAARSRAEPESAPVDGRADEVDSAYSDRSICEGCGSLTRELTRYNGQLLCPDCRTV